MIALIPVIASIKQPKNTRESYHKCQRVTTPYIISLPTGTVDVNTATLNELTTLNGIGEATAREIIKEREQNGAYYYPEDLLAVKGIGRSKLRGLYRQLRFR